MFPRNNWQEINLAWGHILVCVEAWMGDEISLGIRFLLGLIASKFALFMISGKDGAAGGNACHFSANLTDLF
jgi:hypothetical protein